MLRFTTNSFSWSPTYNQNMPELAALEICREARQIGVEGIEIGPERITAADLAETGLLLSGASTGGPLYDEWTAEHADQVVSIAAGVKALGGEYVFFTAAPKGGWGACEEVSPEGLKLAGERLNALAGRVRAEGVAIGLHNHAANPEGLAAELALLRNYTDPALVGVYLDVAWAFVAGSDPAPLVREFAGRCLGFHFRNHRADQIPTETLAEGALDVPALVQAIRATAYQGWVGLELWHRADATVTRSMVECQTESLRWLRELWGE